jgi:predicted alpha/beta superfamily hydrolase
MMRTWLLLLVCGWAQAADMDHLTSLRDVDYLALKSITNQHQYHVFIKAPDTGQATPAGGYPVVILLDGGNLFPMLAAYHQYLELSEELPPVILVGLSYGTHDWRAGNKRSTDYTLPAKDRAHYGGAELFRNMLMSELMPLIETRYPVNQQRKILMGHSIGGQFALYEAMFQPADFFGLIASNPAIHRNTGAFLKSPKATAEQPRLFIMQADGDDETFRLPRQQWLDHWQDQPHHWSMKVETLPGHNHMSSVPAAYRQGMLWLLNDNNHNDSK